MSKPATSWWRRRIGRGPVLGCVRLDGPIGRIGGRRGLSLESVAQPLARAFRLKRSPAVLVIVNSPGGSPVQSALIQRRIRRLAEKHGKRVIVAIEEVAASGGYWLALAGDEILAQPASIVGSIGVISAGFGFQDAIGRLGIERRVHATGGFKGMLDPFRPERAEDVALLEDLQKEVYDDFVNLVKARRGSRLAENAELFDGRFVSGRHAQKLGLVDEVGDAFDFIRERYGEGVRLKTFGTRRWSLLPRFRLEAAVDAVADRLEERAMFMRYGL